MWNRRLGYIQIAEHAIDLNGDARPFKSALNRSGPTVRKLEAFALEKPIEAGVIELAIFEWATLVFFVSQNGREIRFCVNFRALNQMTLKDT